jgi:hypothetical protein
MTASLSATTADGDLEGSWTNLKQALQHTWTGGEYWTLDALFPVKQAHWKQGITPLSDWQVNVTYTDIQRKAYESV